MIRRPLARLAILALGTLAVVSLQYSGDARRARERLDAEARLVETSAGGIEQVDGGRGPAVLLVHGSFEGLDHFFMVMHSDAFYARLFGFLKQHAPAP